MDSGLNDLGTKHLVKIVSTVETTLPSGSSKIHQRITMEEPCETPGEMSWKHRKYLSGIDTAGGAMADLAVKGEIPWVG